ncbi:VrrA/YqfQ family protein [Sporosarcina sp. FSL K6-2383]|uniref:VrrA/YqfQ family protein n=1 Tax=Sporosarcina sp. FSL K6-2383 TaxID=2921556 RepID=UPI00315A585C
MRYESFYPFAQQPAAPMSMGQTGFGLPSQMNPMQIPTPPMQNRSPMGNQMGNQMNNPQGGLAANQGQQQNPSKMESYMQTANQFLNTAQQFAPMVQQFAPMVQNLPAMWRLYKGFQGLPAAGSAVASAGAATSSAATNSAIGSSIPRIFQP